MNNYCYTEKELENDKLSLMNIDSKNPGRIKDIYAQSQEQFDREIHIKLMAYLEVPISIEDTKNYLKNRTIVQRYPDQLHFWLKECDRCTYMFSTKVPLFMKTPKLPSFPGIR